MSALRIRYETMQLKTRYELHQVTPAEAIHLLLLTEDAFHQWASAYPNDPWLASTGYAMAQLYEELPGASARDHAVALLIYVKASFPASRYAGTSRDQLHRGVAIKPEPAWAAALPPANSTASPLPSATADDQTPAATPTQTSPP